jgi:uncharacterized protein YjbI with pentapeptide repeats
VDPLNLPTIIVNSSGALSGTQTSNAVDISETNPSQIGLVQIRTSDFSNPDLRYPDFFSSLNDQAKKEFIDLWDLTQSIKSNANAHKIQNGSRRFITTGPLQLNSFFSEVNEKNIEFSLENFLKDRSISLTRAMLENAQLNGAKLNYAKLNSAQLNGAKLNGAKLNSAQLYQADLNHAELNHAELNQADLNNAELNYAELNYADLNHAVLNHAQLNGAQLNHADLNNAQLNGAKLNHANLNNAQLNGAKLNNIEISFDTQFNKDTELKNIRLNSLSYTDQAGTVTRYTDQDEIRDLFVSLAANTNNISFDSAA